MHKEKYSISSDRDHSVFEFLSQGPKGTIKKVVYYQPIGDNIFNLAFGDWNDDKQRIDDNIRSNNIDRNKVLSTVALTAIDFVKYHPGAIIFVKGSTQSRTRLYQIGISGNRAEIEQMFHIQGFVNGEWEPFNVNTNYERFVFKAK